MNVLVQWRLLYRPCQTSIHSKGCRLPRASECSDSVTVCKGMHTKCRLPIRALHSLPSAWLSLIMSRTLVLVFVPHFWFIRQEILLNIERHKTRTSVSRSSDNNRHTARFSCMKSMEKYRWVSASFCDDLNSETSSHCSFLGDPEVQLLTASQVT